MWALAIAAAGGGPLAAVDARPTALDPPAPATKHGADAVVRCPARVRRLRTWPAFRPTRLCVFAGPAAETAPGRLLVTSKPRTKRKLGESAAIIASSAGKLLWYLPSAERLFDLSAVRYRGRSLLALYRTTRKGDGHYELRDRRYRVVRRVAMGDGLPTDHHELQITPEGTAYLGGYHHVDVPGVGRVIDYVIREIDLLTGRVLFQWRALDHVPLSASYLSRPRGRPWDYFHGNSIEPPAPGDSTIIVSARNTSAVYGIDRRTGQVRWTLGGKRDQLSLASRSPSAIFCTQHDARRLPGGDVLVFDNGGAGKTFGNGCPFHPARVLRFRLDTAAMTASVVWALDSETGGGAGEELFPIALGSSRQLANGNILVSWGTVGRISEVTPDGRLVNGLELPGSTYRAVRAPWVGRPGGRPRIAVERRSQDAVDVWASWNGATEIAGWQVLAGAGPRRLRTVGPVALFADLETRVRARTRARYVAVRAVDARGRSLGRSRAVRAAPSRATRDAGGQVSPAGRPRHRRAAA